MKKFVASYKDENGIIQVMEREYETKKQFANDLRGNGYKVRFISTPDNFDNDCYNYHNKLEQNRRKQQLVRAGRKMFN